MKIQKYLGGIAVVLMLAVAPVAYAATLVPSKTDINASVGDTVSINYSVNPGNTSVYTVKFAAAFPSNILEFISFTFASPWITLAQPGYDEANQANGTFIKTAGYSKGTLAAVPYGTATFRVKAAGNGTISGTSQSFILDKDNKDVLTGSPQTRITVGGVKPKDPVATTTNSVKTSPVKSTNTTVATSSTTTSPTLFDVSSDPGVQKSGIPWSLIMFSWLFLVLLYLAYRTFRWFVAKRRKENS